MNFQRRDFLLVATLAAATARPAFGQAVVPTLAPSSGKENATSIPDLSGIWGRWFNLEPPSSGPGPIVSKLRRPDGSIIQSVVGDYTNPILRPHAAEIVKKNGELELSGIVYPIPTTNVGRNRPRSH